MGAVYEARNVSALKRCAVKVLLTPALAGDHEVVRRFFREARASGLIESEHVVAAFDSGVDDVVGAYYVMECLEGEDLRATLGRLGPINPIAAAKIVLQAASGLASAHALGIVHRDVKPANLFLADCAGDEVRVKILDFGVAKVKMEALHDSLHSYQTQSGSLLGTPLYMSPEQLKRAADIDESADVWSLGVVLFECLSGKLPWGKVDSAGEVIAAILTLQLPMLQDLAPWVKPELAAIVDRALSRDPDHRLRCATELRKALLDLVAGDTRLLRSELHAVSEDERSRAAERVWLADTLLSVPIARVSASPTATSVPAPAPPRRGVRLATSAGVAALVGATAWNFSARPEHNRVAAPAVTTLTPPAPTATTIVAPPAIKSFELAVSALGARISVDGVEREVTDGRAHIEGPVGTVHAVRLSRAGQVFEQLVAITEDGLLPARVSFPQKPINSGHVAEVRGAKAETSKVNLTVPGADSIPSAPDTSLSPKFE